MNPSVPTLEKCPAANPRKVCPPLGGRGSPPGKLSTSLRRLSEETRRGGLSLGEAAAYLHGNTPFLLCAVLALPFCQPVPMVGMSTPFGLALFCLSVGAMLRRCSSLPTRLASVKVPAQVFPSLLKGTSWLVGRVEAVLKPRWFVLTVAPWRFAWAGLMALSALLLMLPLPVPLSNTFPAATILCFALGMLEDDGLAILGGVFLFLATVVFYTLLTLAGAEIWHFVTN